MKILVAETNWTALSVSAELRAQNVAIIRTDDPDELCFLADMTEPTAVVLETKMPGFTIAAAVRKLRYIDRNLGLIAIDHTCDPVERARALEAGVDDVVAHTTDPAEIVARIGAIVRRRAGRSTPLIQVGAVVVDMAERTARTCERPMRLSRLEYQLLEYLALGAGSLRSKNSILTHLYSLKDEPDPRTIDAYVCRIRGEVARLGGDPFAIRTVWGRGYMLEDPADVAVAA